MESFLRKKENLAKAAGRINILFSAFKSQPSYTRILLEDVMVHKKQHLSQRRPQQVILLEIVTLAFLQTAL